MKKISALLLCFVMIFSLFACAEGGQTQNSSAENQTNIANPFIDCKTLDEAAGIAGFAITAPDSLSGYPERVIQAVKDSMIQVIYYAGSLDSDNVRKVYIRKGASFEDIFGDYNDYPEKGDLNVNGVKASFNGSGGKVSNVKWQIGNDCFVIYSDEPLEKEFVSGIIEKTA
ncbi:MAG: hypothetical protein IKS19_06145 [Clostridia bacterium]|nr:hypothetical protein [Clostridia bacterium]